MASSEVPGRVASMRVAPATLVTKTPPPPVTPAAISSRLPPTISSGSAAMPGEVVRMSPCGVDDLHEGAGLGVSSAASCAVAPSSRRSATSSS